MLILKVERKKKARKDEIQKQVHKSKKKSGTGHFRCSQNTFATVKMTLA
jgi:hypothetical protein